MELKKILLVSFVISLFLNMPFAAVLDYSGSIKFQEETVDESLINNFSCSTSSLTPEEVQAFKEKILDSGFTAKEISAGTPPLKDRETLENNTALLISPDSNIAQKVELPNQEISPGEISYLLDNRYDGAYSFGLLLNDTLRVGQCKDQEANCPLMGNNLTLRTDGEGFKEDFVSVWTDLKATWSGWFEEDKLGEDLPAETKQQLKDYFDTEDENEIGGTIVRKIPGEYMPNSVLTDEFTASMGTTCVNSSCTISSYSFFDKHFNQWFSANMVTQIAAPTLWFGAKKLLASSGRRGILGAKFIDIENSAFVKNMREKIWGPDAFFGKKLGESIMAQKVKYDGFGDFFEEFVEATAYQKGMTSSMDAAVVIRKYMDPRTSPLFINGKISIEKKKAFVKMAKDLKRYTQTADSYAQAAKSELATKIELYGRDSANGIVARREYGAKMARLFGKFDDDIDADLPNMLANAKRMGLWHKGIKNNKTGEIQTILNDTDQWNNINKAFSGHPKYEFANKSAKDYTPGTFANWDHYETVGDGLQFYKLDKVKLEREVGIDDLEKMLNKGETTHLYTKIDDAYIEIDHKTIDFIKKYQQPGDVKLYTGGWTKDNVLQPEEMGDLMADWGANRVQKARTQNELLWNTLRERNWAERRYFNAMDRVFANEERLANAYFRTAGGAAKYTVYPYVYWQAKRGFGFESMSAYMLPETWSRINYSAGSDPLYNDAFIDFFANAGSDQGDLFSRLINNLPWKYVLNAVSNQFNPVKAQYDKYTQPDGGVRSKTGNIAVYSNTSDNCAGCGITLTAPSKTNFTAVFKSESKTSSIILEDTPIEEKKNGATLITYAHHMDLTGVYEGQEQKVSLIEAIKEEKINTCQQAIEKAGWGVGFADKLGINAGGYLAATEAAGYLVFGMGGAIFSAVQQFVIASKLQDCVDTTEGYYTHFFVPSIKEEASPKEDTVEYSTQKVSNFIDDASAQMEAALTGSGTVTQDAVNTIRDELDSLSGGAKSSDLVQATYDTLGFSRGMMQGIRLFYFWVAGGTIIEPSKYKTDGKMVIKGTNDQNIISDNALGQLIVDGVPVLTSKDNVRLASTNLAIPAIEYPQTLTNIRLSGDANELVFKLKISSDGLSADLIVESTELLDCIKDGVMKQTGLPLTSDNLSQAFGKFQEMKTDSHSSIFVQRGQIVAEGIPRKVALTNPGLEVYGDRSVKLINSKDNEPAVGSLEGIYFENGFVLYKPETNELIFWLKHHEQGKLEQNDVFGLDVTPKTQINPVTGCEEYVFDLDVLGDPESPAKQAKVDAFNQSLDHMGPFNVFRTDKKTYVFYEDKDCIVRLKIIDNETGKVLYDEAVESIVSTDDGFNVKTADGQTHDFGFSTEDGRPFLDYNGVKELLRSIGGQNGSMWYDPNTGMWYAENAQLLPLLDLFRQQGIKTTVDQEGNVKSVPGENLMNININDKTASNPFNLPSLPENALMLSLFVLGLISFMLFTQFSFFRNRKN